VSVRSLSPRVQLALVAGGLLAVAVLGYLVLVAPKRSAAADLHAEIEATETQLRSRPATRRAEPAPGLDAADVFRATRAVPDDPAIPEVILELTQLASISDVSLESIAPGPAVDRQGYRAVPITVVGNGRYFAFADFLARIRALVRSDGGKLRARGRLLTVDSVSFAEGEGGFPKTRATLHLNAVFGASSAAAGTTTSPTGTSAPGSGEPAAASAPSTSGDGS
jgi:Tfp pilus assembly protein PilO